MLIPIFALIAASAQATGSPSDMTPGAATARADGEAEASHHAVMTNALADYKAYLQNFPNGTDADAIRTLVASREAIAANFAAHPTEGFRRADYVEPLSRIFSPDNLRKIRKIAPTGGSVRATWIIATDGQIENCRIVTSSGSPQLDQLTCAIITNDVKGIPARDEHGMPVPANDLRTINWPL